MALSRPDDTCLPDLTRYHAQHFCFNAIKLIKAAPSTTLHQTRENATHGFIIQAFSTVEDYTLHTHGLSKVFDRLSLACESGDSNRMHLISVHRPCQQSVKVNSYQSDNCTKMSMVGWAAEIFHQNHTYVTVRKRGAHISPPTDWDTAMCYGSWKVPESGVSSSKGVCPPNPS